MDCHLTAQSNKILNFIFSDMGTTDLIKYAEDGHGFVADEGFYWVQYYTDLDEYEVEVEGHIIPSGMVEIYLWGELDEGKVIFLPITDYLCALTLYLQNKVN